MSKSRGKKKKNSKTCIKISWKNSKYAIRILNTIYGKEGNIYYIGQKQWNRILFTNVEIHRETHKKLQRAEKMKKWNYALWIPINVTKKRRNENVGLKGWYRILLTNMEQKFAKRKKSFKIAEDRMFYNFGKDWN